MKIRLNLTLETRICPEDFLHSTHSPSKYFSSDVHKPGVLNLCTASVVTLTHVALSIGGKCCPSSTAMPTHHWLLEGIASFQKASAGSQT